jgi:rubrerythrin
MTEISVAELYAHAIAMEREAAQRYDELAKRMADQGNDEVAALFSRLSRIEAEHLQTLLERTRGVELPRLDAAEHAWLDAGAPETAARELVFRLMTPRQALAIALDAERRARAFFEQMMRAARDPGVRALAREMANEEIEHIAMVLELLQRIPAPYVPCE